MSETEIARLEIERLKKVIKTALDLLEDESRPLDGVNDAYYLLRDERDRI